MDLVTVTECQSEFDAKLVANYLEANGIRAYISGGAASLARVAHGVPCGAVVQVAKSDAKTVAKLLKERVDDSAKANGTRSWTDKVTRSAAWFVVAVLAIGILVPLVCWLFGWN